LSAGGFLSELFQLRHPGLFFFFPHLSRSCPPALLNLSVLGVSCFGEGGPFESLSDLASRRFRVPGSGGSRSSMSALFIFYPIVA